MTREPGVVQVEEEGPQPSSSREGIELRLVPSVLELTLDAEPSAAGPGESGPMWHPVGPLLRMRVLLRSHEAERRIVELSARSQAPDESERWVRWSFDPRPASQTAQNPSLSGYDALAPDESRVTMLIQGGEERSASLAFAVPMNRETRPGEYCFDVVVQDRSGAERSEPARLCLRHPPAAWLRQLPAIYSDTPPRRDPLAPFEDRPFFERFLRGFEDALAPSQAILAHLERFFDPSTAPEGFLSWLATWVAMVLDENWPVLKRRRLIAQAVELYRWRGTKRGLSDYLEIYTGARPTIHDQPYPGMRLGESARLGPGNKLGGVLPHTFVVTLAVPDLTAINEQIVRQIIESEKPAHTAYRLQIVERAPGGK